MVWWMQTCARLSWKSALLLKDLKTSKSWHPVVWLFACTKLGEHREFASLFTMTHQPRDLVHVDLKVKSSTCLQDILFVKLSKVLKCFKEVAFISIIFTYTFFSPIFLHLFSAMLFFSKKKTKQLRVLKGLKAQGVKVLALRCSGTNNVDLKVAQSLGLQKVRWKVGAMNLSFDKSNRWKWNREIINMNVCNICYKHNMYL